MQQTGISIIAIAIYLMFVPNTNYADQQQVVKTGKINERALKLCRRQYESRKPERALKNCLKAARSGSPTGYLILGLIYEAGLTVVGTRDPVMYPELAYKSFRKSAELGHPQAYYLVGQMLEAGKGVAKDEQEGWAWKQKALELGYRPKLETIIH